MSTIQQCVTRLIETARRLRKIADELNNVELKTQIIDEISSLQDIRDALADSADSNVDLSANMVQKAAEPDFATPDKAKALGENAMNVYTPAENAGTYALTEEEPEVVEETVDETEEETVDETEEESPAANDPEHAAKRAVQAEKAIAELEVILQDAIHTMNSILTPEQKTIKVRETKSGEAAGKSAAEIRNAVYAAMKLTDEQKVHISDSRKQIQQIRASIAEELTWLMDDEQRDKIKSKSGVK
jgi:hypothetical protein